MKENVQKIPQLRICVTEECEYGCFYCRPGGESCRLSNKNEMNLRQIYQLVSMLTRYGIAHLKITGGEPLARKDIPRMVQLLNSITGIEDIQLVTRSPTAGKLASHLKDAKLSCLNFSLDSLDYYTFFKITRNGRLDLLLQAVEKVYQSGLKLKFNMVVMRGINAHEIPAMVEFAGKYGATLKLLDLMNLPKEPQFLPYYYQPFDQIVEDLKVKAIRYNTEKSPGGLGTPMLKFEMPNGATVLVKDARVGTWYGDICKECKNFPCQDAIMALRLTADGCLQRCLLRQDNLVDLLSMVENFESENLIKQVVDSVLDTFRKAVYHEKAWQP